MQLVLVKNVAKNPMLIKKLFFAYIPLLCALTIFSWGFIDANFPYSFTSPFKLFLDKNLHLTTVLYISFVLILFLLYGWILFLAKTNKLKMNQLTKIIAINIFLLVISYPAFSNDIFNYIATAKVTFLYKENPYVVMPIDIPNEPMLTFLHASNKIALYGPIWILFSALPHFLGGGNLLVTMLMFKIFVALFYVGILWLLWNISRKNIWAVAFFGLNPLVIIETFVSGHNDVVMMFLALLAFFLIQKKKLFLSTLVFLLSILIKYATLFLIPVFVFLLFSTIRKRNINWQKIWFWSGISMYTIFFLSPLREEIYSWYFIWIIPFIALLDKVSLITFISIGFSFGLLFRIAPYILTKTWIGYTPLIKKLVTFIPPFIIGIGYVFKKKI